MSVKAHHRKIERGPEDNMFSLMKRSTSSSVTRVDARGSERGWPKKRLNCLLYIKIVFVVIYLYHKRIHKTEK